MSVHEPRTKISQVPVANEKLYEEVARLTRQRKEDVQEQVEFIGEFVAGIMKKGEMQGVMIPYFGKFRPKVKKLQAMKNYQRHKANGTSEIVQALKGKPVKAVKLYPDTGKAEENITTNETI